MVRFYIDGEECDLGSTPTIPIDFSIERLCDPNSARSGRRLEFDLPSTPTNDRLLGSSRDIFSARRFNKSYHYGHFECDGVRLLGGRAHLVATALNPSASTEVYRICIAESGAEWAKEAVVQQVEDGLADFSTTLTLDNIGRSWSEDCAVRFLPVVRNRTEEPTSPTLEKSEHLPMSDDYHPFISVAHAIEHLAESCGYQIEGGFTNSALFKSLMMSGQYASTDTDRLRERLDFCARRKTEVSATASSLGRVYATPAVLLHSLGNIVDTADPTAIDDEGNTMYDCFATGGSFGLDAEGFARFRASTAASVGFLLHLEYRTDYRIASRYRLAGFDRIEAHPATLLSFAIANTFTDHRNAPTAGLTYNLVIFDFVEGADYRLSICDERGTQRQTIRLANRATKVTMPSNFKPVCSLVATRGDEGEQFECDWALYNGFVEERGTTSVTVDLRIPPQKFSAGQEFRLDKIWFGGADEGMTLTLGRGTSLRPYFSTVPGYGSTITAADITHRPVRLMELLEALGQMFHLCFITDRERKRLFIAPLDSLYSDVVYDWSDRIDYSAPITFADAGVGVAERYRLKYRGGDRTSARFNSDNQTELGTWSIESGLYGSLDTTSTSENALFTTGINCDSVYGSAPSASILCVDDEVESEKPPYIVRWAGLQPLPEGEQWGYPLNEPRYPHAAFHFAGNERVAGSTLCFEDRDRLYGLHHYYDRHFRVLCDRQTLTLRLRLTPFDIEHLLLRDGVTPSIGDTFRLTINRESSLYRLTAIKEYDPESGSTLCHFVRIDRD